MQKKKLGNSNEMWVCARLLLLSHDRLSPPSSWVLVVLCVFLRFNTVLNMQDVGFVQYTAQKNKQPPKNVNVLVAICLFNSSTGVGMHGASRCDSGAAQVPPCLQIISRSAPGGANDCDQWATSLP